MSEAQLRPLSYGQLKVLSLFAGSNIDVVLQPVDMFEARICGALEARGLLTFYKDEDVQGWELTPAGREIVEEKAPLRETGKAQP